MRHQICYQRVFCKSVGNSLPSFCQAISQSTPPRKTSRREGEWQANWVSFSVWLNSLLMVISRFVHVTTDGMTSFTLTAELYCAYVSRFYPFISWWTHSFCVLTVANSATVNTGAPASFQITVFSRYVLRSGTDGSYSSSIFSFLWNLQIVLRSSRSSLHFHRHCRWVSFSPHHLQLLLFVDFFNDGHSDQCEVITSCCLWGHTESDTIEAT